MRRAFDFDTNRWNHDPATNSLPTAPPREGFWIATPPKAKPKKSMTFRVIVAASFGASVIATIVSHGELFPITLMVGIFSMIFLSPGEEKPLFFPSPEDTKLLEDEADLDVCLVWVKICVNGREIGNDRGAAWFADGRLLFNGHKTSFALGGQDIYANSDRPKWVPANGETFEHLPLRHPTQKAYLKFVPLHSQGLREPAEIRFLRRLFEFRKQSSVSHQERQWPPLEA